MQRDAFTQTTTVADKAKDASTQTTTVADLENMAGNKTDDVNDTAKDKMDKGKEKVEDSVNKKDYCI